jgi:hypothetical protein
MTVKKKLPAKVKLPAKSTAPAILQQSLPTLDRLRTLELTKGLPNATIIYGIASGALFAFALYLLVAVSWVDGLLTLFPAAIFLGFAVHLMKYGQPKR